MYFSPPNLKTLLRTWSPLEKMLCPPSGKITVGLPWKKIFPMPTSSIVLERSNVFCRPIPIAWIVCPKYFNLLSRKGRSVWHLHAWVWPRIHLLLYRTFDSLSHCWITYLQARHCQLSKLLQMLLKTTSLSLRSSKRGAFGLRIESRSCNEMQFQEYVLGVEFTSNLNYVWKTHLKTFLFSFPHHSTCTWLPPRSLVGQCGLSIDASQCVFKRHLVWVLDDIRCGSCVKEQFCTGFKAKIWKADCNFVNIS